MNRTQREQIIMMFMPAAVAVLLYSLVLYFTNHRKHYEQELAKLDKAQATGKSENDVLIAKAKLDRSEAELKERQQMLESRLEQLTTFSRNFGASDNQFRVVEQISQLLRDKHVALLSQTPVKKPQLSSPSQRMLEAIDQYNGERELAYHQFELYGRYRDVRSFLTEFGELDIATIPISLRLKSSQQKDGLHTWNLIVVM